MANYTIIGGDLKEYGPITADDVSQWIAEGRLNEMSRIKSDTDPEFRELGTFPEFAAAFAATKPLPKLPRSAFAIDSGAPEPTDYQLDLLGCLTRGWELVKANFGLLFVATLVVMLIQGAISGLGSIPYVGAIFSIANLFITGPLMGGLYYVILQTGRGQTAEVGDVFIGFRKSFAQLFLGHLVPALLAGLCLIPLGIVVAISVLPLVLNGQFDPNNLPKMSAVSVLLIGFAALVGIIPLIYLQTCWAFTLPLIMDKGLDFWTAMGVSRKMVSKHWWQVFGLTIVIGLLNLVGLCACCVGVLFTLPIGFAALMFAYETIFAEASDA